MSHAIRPLCIAALVCACPSDDTSQVGGSSSSSGAPPGSSDGTPSTSSTSDAPGSTSSTGADTSSSSGGSSSGNESAGDCSDALDLLQDGGFEGAGYAWRQTTNFLATVIFDTGFQTTGDTFGPSEGTWWAWFTGIGGVGFHDVSHLSQAVEIEPATSVTLSFDFWIGSISDTSSTDRFIVRMDDEDVFVAGVKDHEQYAAYTPIAIDVTAWADGGMHQLEIVAVTDGGMGAITSFNADRFALVACGGAGRSLTQGEPPADEDTATPLTGTDTLGMLSMCVETLPATVPQQVDGDNTDGTNTVTGSCSFNGADDGLEVVYELVAPADGIYVFDTLGSTLADTVLYLYDGCEGGSELACNDDLGDGERRSRVAHALATGQSVAIVVDGWNAAQLGAFTLSITQLACDAPLALGTELPVVDAPGDNVGTGDDVAGSCGGSGGEDVVLSWTAPAAGLYQIDTLGSAIDHALYVYEGTCGDPAGELACATNGILPPLALAADQTVTIVVDGLTDLDTGGFELSITSLGELVGDCCSADGSPGCESPSVTHCVCDLELAIMPGCCEDGWSSMCAGLASSQCAAGCATVDGGSCCTPSFLEAGCDVQQVEDCVCAFDPFCCDWLGMGYTWDALCVSEAVDYCFADCGS